MHVKVDIKSVDFLVVTNFLETNLERWGVKNAKSKKSRHVNTMSTRKSTQTKVLILLVLPAIYVDMLTLYSIFRKKKIIVCVYIYIYNKGKKFSTQQHLIWFREQAIL